MRPEDLVRRLAPKGNMIIDTKRTVHYYRPSHDGKRILMGGRPLLKDSEAEDEAPHLRRFMVDVWPELKDVQITHAWGGKMGFTCNTGVLRTPSGILKIVEIVSLTSTDLIS